MTAIYLGFDFGMKSIGVATGQSILQTASPLCALKAHKGVPNWEEVKRLYNNWRPQGIVVGIPLNMNGSEQFVTPHAKQFAEHLNNLFPAPVHEMDERLTTKASREYLFETHGYRGLTKQNIDAYSAKLILQDWLRQNFC
jgi:putative Holliday junction resolvase